MESRDERLVPRSKKEPSLSHDTLIHIKNAVTHIVSFLMLLIDRNLLIPPPLPPLSLQTFYSQVSSPLLRKIAIQFTEDTVSDVTQNRFDKYFSGSELVVAGKVLPSESNILTSFTTAAAVSSINTTMH